MTKKTNSKLSVEQLLKFNYFKTQGDSCSDLGDFSSAIINYDEALKIDNNEAILYNKGMCQYDLEDFDGAMITFELLTTLNTKDDGSIRWLAKTYLANGLIEWSLDKYKEAIQLNKDVYYYWIEIGEVYIKLGLNEEAINAFSNASKLENSTYIYYNLGKLYYENRFNNSLYLDYALTALSKAVNLNDSKCLSFKPAKQLLKIVKSRV